jgi:tetratricopeptide (TPR) repeat protein
MPGPETAPARRAAFAALLLMGAVAASQERPDALKLYLEGRYDDARRVCLEEIAAAPEGVESYVVLSWTFLAQERWADAENYALKGYSIRKDPRLSEALGEAAFQLGRNEAALRNLQNYISAVPEGARAGSAYYYIGEVYLRLARFAHADMAFTAALQYSPDNARWWVRLGWAREKAADPAHALEAYDRALSLDPRLQDAVNGKARVAAGLR